MRGDKNGFRDVNKPRKYRVDDTCKSKRRFVDEIGAHAGGIVDLTEQEAPKPNGKWRLWCYRCKHCAGWHLTHTNLGSRWEIRVNDPAPMAGATA